MHLRDFVMELGQTVGDAALSLDSAGCCRMLVDDGIEVTLRGADAGRTCEVKACLGPKSVADWPRQRTLLLEASLLGRGVRGAVFALDETGGNLLLIQRIALDEASSREAMGQLETYFNMLEAWSQRLGQPLTTLRPKDALTGSRA